MGEQRDRIGIVETCKCEAGGPQGPETQTSEEGVLLVAAGIVGVHRKIPAELGLRPLRCFGLVLVPLKGVTKLCSVVQKRKRKGVRIKS